MATVERDIESLPDDPIEIERLLREALEGFKFKNYVQHFKVIDRRSGKLVPFRLNSVQLKLRATIEEEIRAGRPVRLIVLKSRRMGVSTLIQASFAQLAFTQEFFTVLTGAHQQSASSTLHGMTEMFYRSLPEKLQEPGTIQDADLVGEMRTFVTKKSGKVEADGGCHDDRVMSRAITAQVRNLRASKPLRIPLTPQQEAKKMIAEAQRRSRSRNSLANRIPRFSGR